MIRLRMEGWSERELRSHSLEWLEVASEEANRKKRLALADQLNMTVLAVAAGQGSEEAQSQVDETTQMLRLDDDPEVAYLLDPNAQPDYAAIEAAQGKGDMPVGFQTGPAPMPEPSPEQPESEAPDA
jgi:hypothetical protein